jgi:hypothetical protein
VIRSPYINDIALWDENSVDIGCGLGFDATTEIILVRCLASLLPVRPAIRAFGTKSVSF